ncbi:MAG: CotH kinase family protein [Clostridia bacterium]|nr:CotH kinase family protein [Clostridia bacterium]
MRSLFCSRRIRPILTAWLICFLCLPVFSAAAQGTAPQAASSASAENTEAETDDAGGGETEGAFQNGDAPFGIRLRVFSAAGAEIVLQKSNGTAEGYTLFEPADCDCGNLLVAAADAPFSVDGRQVVPGQPTAVFQPGADHTLTVDGRSYPLRVMRSAHLPSMFITTESGTLSRIHADKAHKEPGLLTLVENGAAKQERAALSYVKGRGNSTWKKSEKKPYNIKLSEKAGLLGMAEAKKWCLLANALDPTLLHNAVMLRFAQETDLPYTVDFRYVDLYVNGEYRGNYMLCEKIELGSARIAIRDLDKENEKENPGVSLDSLPTATDRGDSLTSAKGGRQWVELPNAPADNSGGYLLEYDYNVGLGDDPAFFYSDRETALVVKSPEYASREQVDTVADLYQQLEDALYDPDGRDADWKRFLDLPSVVDSYLLLEYSENTDFGIPSYFLFKPEGEDRFYAGPAWDFDRSLLLTDKDALLGAANLLSHPTTFLPSDKTLFYPLCRRAGFWTQAARRWDSYEAFASVTLPEYARKTAETIRLSADMDCLRWDRDADERQTECEALIDFLPQRAEGLTKALKDPESAIRNMLDGRAFDTEQEVLHLRRGSRCVPAVLAVAGVAGAGAVAGAALRKKRKKT